MLIYFLLFIRSIDVDLMDRIHINSLPTNHVYIHCSWNSAIYIFILLVLVLVNPIQWLVPIECTPETVGVWVDVLCLWPWSTALFVMASALIWVCLGQHCRHPCNTLPVLRTVTFHFIFIHYYTLCNALELIYTIWFLVMMFFTSSLITTFSCISTVVFHFRSASKFLLWLHVDPFFLISIWNGTLTLIFMIKNSLCMKRLISFITSFIASIQPTQSIHLYLDIVYSLYYWFLAQPDSSRASYLSDSFAFIPISDISICIYLLQKSCMLP